MKRKLFFIIALLLTTAATMQAQTATPKAIWCAGNTTLYFVYDTNTYAAGGTYDGQTITKVYADHGYPNNDFNNHKWTDAGESSRLSMRRVVFEPSYYNEGYHKGDYSRFFENCRNLTTVENEEYLGPFTYMYEMFYHCESLTSLDVGNWDVSQVTNMEGAFSGCYLLTSLDVSNWDVSRVTSMLYAFSGNSLTSFDVSNWDVGNVTNMENAFEGNNFTSLDVSNWDVSNVTTMHQMFAGCNYLASLDVSNWNVGNVTNMEGMFRGCRELVSLDVSNWNVGSVTDMREVFKNCWELTSLDVSGWNVGNVTSMTGMFTDCWELTSLDVSAWNVGNVHGMGYMFANCYELASLDVSNWDVSRVTDMQRLFGNCNCSSFTSLDVSNWDVSNVTNMEAMFSMCWSLTSLDVSKWKTNSVTNTRGMFEKCSSLTSLTFGKDFNTNGISESFKYRMFNACDRLRYIDFSASDDTDAITSVNRNNNSTMFGGTPRTTVIYLPHGSRSVTGAENVVYSYGGDETDLRCPEYYSADRGDFVIINDDDYSIVQGYVDIEFPYDFKANKAIYQRTMSNSYGSVILPYEFKTNSSVQAYTLDEEHTETMYFRDAQTIPPHTPFAFYKKASGSTADFTVTDASGEFGITVKATHTTHPDETGWDGVAGSPYTDGYGENRGVKLSGWSTKGYYINQTIDKDDALYPDLHYIAGEKFYKAGGETLKFPPHRVTFHGAWAKGNLSAGAKAFVFASVNDDDIVNAIDAAEVRRTLREAEAVYDVSGRRLTEARKGVNLVRMGDGSVKKVFIK